MIETSVREVMNAPARTVDPDATVSAVAQRLTTHGIGSLVVCEDTIAGIVTESDVVGVVADRADPAEVPVREAMSSPVTTVDPDATIDEAATILRDNDIKKLPVVRDGDLVGIVTASDLARHVPEYRLRIVEDAPPRA